MLIKRDNANQRTPSIVNRPRLKAKLAWIYYGFVELSSRRECGWSYQPLPLSEIISWLDFNGINCYSARRLFVRMVIDMDAAWLNWHIEQEKKKKPKR